MEQSVPPINPPPHRFSIPLLIGITLYAFITGSMLLYIVLPTDQIKNAFLGSNTTTPASQSDTTTTSKTVGTPSTQNSASSTKKTITYAPEQMAFIKAYLKGSGELSTTADAQIEPYITSLANNGTDIYAMIQTIQKELNCTTAMACAQTCASEVNKQKCESITKQYISAKTIDSTKTILNKTYDSVVKNDITNLGKALTTCYYEANKQYPSTLTALVPDCIGALPKNPNTNTVYVYNVTSSGFSLQGTLSTKETIVITELGESIIPASQ